MKNVIFLFLSFSSLSGYCQTFQLGKVDTLEGDFFFEHQVQQLYLMPGDYILREPLHVRFDSLSHMPDYWKGVYVSLSQINQVLGIDSGNAKSYAHLYLSKNRDVLRYMNDEVYMKTLNNLSHDEGKKNDGCLKWFPFIKSHLKMAVVYVGENNIDVPNLMMATKVKTLKFKIPVFIILKVIKWEWER